MKRSLEREDKVVYCSRIERSGQAQFPMGFLKLRGLGFGVEE
jgi:hypothetical protein